MKHEFARELEVAKSAAAAAAKEILRLGPKARVDKEDGSPITAADIAANEIICGQLREAFPHDGLLSEETTDGPERLLRRRVWIIDPLDGTRDFVAGTGHYAVHVALVVDGETQLGVVAEPSAHRMSWAVRGQGAFRVDAEGPPGRLFVSTREHGPWRIGTSRFARNEALEAFLGVAPAAEAVPMGASTKLMALARGELEACVWLSSVEKEWDTCAPGIIVCEAGGKITSARGETFRYNQPRVVHGGGILASNGILHERLLARAQPFAPKLPAEAQP